MIIYHLSGDSFVGSYETLSPPHPSPTPESEAPLETGSSKDGFWILRKDTERRSTLVKILTEDQDMVSSYSVAVCVRVCVCVCIPDTSVLTKFLLGVCLMVNFSDVVQLI